MCKDWKNWGTNLKRRTDCAGWAKFPHMANKTDLWKSLLPWTFTLTEGVWTMMNTFYSTTRRWKMCCMDTNDLHSVPMGHVGHLFSKKPYITPLYTFCVCVCARVETDPLTKAMLQHVQCLCLCQNSFMWHFLSYCQWRNHSSGSTQGPQEHIV